MKTEILKTVYFLAYLMECTQWFRDIYQSYIHSQTRAFYFKGLGKTVIKTLNQRMWQNPTSVVFKVHFTALQQKTSKSWTTQIYPTIIWEETLSQTSALLFIQGLHQGSGFYSRESGVWHQWGHPFSMHVSSAILTQNVNKEKDENKRHLMLLSI